MWQKRRGYVEAVVHLISQASHKKELRSASYVDVISHLFQTTLDICVQGEWVRGPTVDSISEGVLSFSLSESQDQEVEDTTSLLQTILSLFNTCSPSGGVRQKILDIILHILDEMPSIHYLSLPLLSAGDVMITSLFVYIPLSEPINVTLFWFMFYLYNKEILKPLTCRLSINCRHPNISKDSRKDYSNSFPRAFKAN